MKTFLCILPFLFVLILVVFTEGKFDGFTMWNCIPVIAAIGALKLGLSRQISLSTVSFVSIVAFSLIAAGFVALFHLAWWFDWHGTQTSSSTSALTFIFVPVWAIAFGIIGAAITWVIARIFCRSK